MDTCENVVQTAIFEVYDIVPAPWPGRFRLVNNVGRIVGQGDHDFCAGLKAQYDACIGKPDCKTCGHSAFEHLHPSWPQFDKCKFDLNYGGWCNCMRYRP